MAELPSTKAKQSHGPLRRKLIALILCFGLIPVGIALGDRQDGRPDPLHRQVFANRFAAWLDWFVHPIEINGFLRPSYIEQNLTDVAMSEHGSRLWVVASRGKIITSDDSGRSWRNLISGTDAGLAAIAILRDGACGWVVGDRGTVLKSEDAGASWSRQDSGTSADLYTVAMQEDCLHGWIGGADIVLHTDDGGAHWRTARVPDPSQGGYIAARMRSDGNGFLVHQGHGLMKTEDRGASWSLFESGTTSDFEDLAMAPAGQRGWGTSWRGELAQTADGGRTWNVVDLPFDSVLWRMAISTNAQRGILADRDGRILFTADGGKSWTSTANPLGTNLNAVALSQDGLTGVAVGGPGAIILTRDGGRTWRPLTRGGGEIRSIFMAADGKTVWMTGDGPNLLKSEDRGRTWLPQLTLNEPWLNGTRTLRGFHMAPDGMRGWMAGDHDVFWTLDGGRTWSARRVMDFSGTLDFHGITDFKAFDDGAALLTGYPYGRVLQVDADLSRRASDRLADFTFDGLAISSDRKRIWAIGRGPSIAASEDGGQSWQTVPIAVPDRIWLQAVAMAPDGMIGCIAGMRGSLFMTEDGGRTWAPRDSGTRATFNAATLAADGRGWVVGDYGRLLATEDGGHSWHRREAPFRVSLTAITMNEKGVGFLGGFALNLATTEDGGAHWQWRNTYGLHRAPWVYAWALFCLAVAACIAWPRKRADSTQTPDGN